MNTRNRRKDEAVSPVVGVLLMLVVTIIIAAVVSGFAGGLTKSADKTPQVVLEVTYVNGTGLTPQDDVLRIKHLSGDSINTANTQILTSWTSKVDRVAASGQTVDARVPNFARTTPLLDYTTCPECNALELGLTGDPYHEPYLVLFPSPGSPILPYEPPQEPVSWGNYVLNAGDLAKAEMSLCEGCGQDYPLIKNVDCLQKGDVINFKLIDTISGGTIYEANVRVQ